MSYGTSRALVIDCAGSRDVDVWREFDRLYRERLVYGVLDALRRSGLASARADAEDYVQEVYCRLLERDGRILRLCRGDTEAQIGRYLQTVAERVALDVIRGQIAKKRGGCVSGVRSVDSPDTWPDERRTTSPEEHALASERRRLFFAKCRSALGEHGSRRDLYILYLALFECCTSPEIAARLGGAISSHTVDSRICRMRSRLRRREGIELPRRGCL